VKSHTIKHPNTRRKNKEHSPHLQYQGPYLRIWWLSKWLCRSFKVS